MDKNLLLEKVARLERGERLTFLLSAAAIVLLSISALLQWHRMRILAHPETLTLRRLNIDDQHGIARVIPAAPAPEPMVLGKQHRLGGNVSGVIIADATGTERGGYVTSDSEYANAMLTLDGQGKRTVLLLAEPKGETLLVNSRTTKTGGRFFPAMRDRPPLCGSFASGTRIAAR